MDELAKAPPRVVNLGLHLLVSSAEIDVVAVCLHPLGIRAADASHYLLDKDKVPYVAPLRSIALPSDDVKSYRRLAYQAAVVKVGKNQAAIADHMGVSPRTLRNWRRRGEV